MSVVDLNGDMAGVGRVELSSQFADNVEQSSEHVDLRPVIANRKRLNPDVLLNVMDEEQVGVVVTAIEEEGRRWIPGQAISSDRQYRSVMTDFNLMSVDSPKYGIVKQSLKEYWDRRGLGRGQVAAVTDVRRARAYQLMAEIGDVSMLDEGQEREVDAVLGQGSVGFYKGLSQEEKDRVLVDGYVDSFVGGAPALSRVYLAEQIGLKTDEVGPMAAELRRQAGVGRVRREQVKKDMAEVWGEILSATGSGKPFSLDPRDHPGRSSEFLAAAGQMAESQKRAAALVKEMAYGEDGKSPHAQGLRTGVTGLRVAGYTKEGEGGWLVTELTKLNREDPAAYEIALGAIHGLVQNDDRDSGFMGRLLDGVQDQLRVAKLFSGVMAPRITKVLSKVAEKVTGTQAWGMTVAPLAMTQTVVQESAVAQSVWESVSNVVGQTVEGVALGPMRSAAHQEMMRNVGLRKKLAAVEFFRNRNPDLLNSPELEDPQWIQRVNKVAQDIQQIRMEQFQPRSEHGMLKFMEESSSVIGAAVPFIATAGVAPALQVLEQEQTEYLANGADPLRADLAAGGEAAAMWAVNIVGLGKGGKLVGNAYDRLMNWAGKKAGYTGLLSRALTTDRWWGRGPLFVGLEGGVLHAQTVVEPYARFVASNMFTGGDGKGFDESLAEAKDAMTWRNFMVALPMSVLLGYGRYAQNSPFRASDVAIARFKRMKLEWADCPEAMEGGGFAREDVKAILNAKDDREKLRLFDLGLERSRMMERVREGRAKVNNDIALLIVPDSPEVSVLMDVGAIPRAEIVNGKVRIYDAAPVKFLSSNLKEATEDGAESAPARVQVDGIPKDSDVPDVVAEFAPDAVAGSSAGKNAPGGDKGGDGKGFIEMSLEEGNYYLTQQALAWYHNQDFTLKNAVLGNEAVDFFAKRCDVEFKRSGALMSRNYLQRMADEALNRLNERRHSSKEMSREDAVAQEEDLTLSMLPGSFRSRVEVAMKRNELNRAPEAMGDVTSHEVDGKGNDSSTHAVGMNYELECGKKVIRYYEGEADFITLVEEMAELYVKGELAGGREMTWFVEHLKETQKYFKEQGLREWMLGDEALLDGRSGAEMQRMAVVEGMSKLMKVVYVGEFRKKNLPESVQRFLEVAMALLRKVADMAGLAGAFRKAVNEGVIKQDFASFIYDAVGADFIQSKHDAAKRDFQSRLNEIKGRPERLLGYYDLHVEYAKRFGLEDYLYQLDHPDSSRTKTDSKFLNYVGDEMRAEFNSAGREFFEKMKGAGLEEMETLLQAARSWNRRYKDIYKFPVEPGRSIHFSVKERLEEMGKDAGKRQVMDFVDRVVASDVADKTQLGAVEYRVVSAREIADIKAGLGIDVSGMRHEFTADGITHALKKHGHDSETTKNQLDLTKDDVKLALDVLDGYDRIEFKDRGDNRSSVDYVKEYPHGELHTVEQVIETTGRRFAKKPRLTFKTAWVSSTSTGSRPGTMEVYTPQRRKNTPSDTNGDVKGISFSLRDESSSAESLPEVAAAWKKQLEDYVDGRVPDKRRDLRVGPTPAALRMLGADAYDLVITPIVLDKVTEGKHAVPVSELERLPEALSRPLAVFESGTQADSLVALTELKEGDHNVVVAVHLNASGGRVQVNRIASVYGKDNPRALFNTPLLFLDKKKADAWLTANRLQLPAAVPSNHRTKKKIMTPKDVFKWKEGHGLPPVTFSLRDDLSGEVQGMMERTRSAMVREYWGHVLGRLEEEERAMKALFRDPKGDAEFVRARVAEARGVMKVAVETLPASVRGKLAGYERQLDYLMEALARGYFTPGHTLAAERVAQMAAEMGIRPEEMGYFVGRRVDELALKTFRRASEVIDLYVRDGLFAETRQMIAHHEAVIDEETRKFKVSRLGAGATEFLRRVVRPAVYATRAEAEKRAGELSDRLRMLEMKLNEFKEGNIVAGMDGLLLEQHRVEREFNWWMNFSAAGSSDLNRMSGIHEAVQNFVSRSAEAWQAHLEEKVNGWKKDGQALKGSLKAEVNQKSMHLAEGELTDLGVDSESGRRKKGVLLSWLDNTVRTLQRMGDGPGGKFFTRFKTEFLNVTNRTQFLHAQEIEHMNALIKKISGSSSERELNQWLSWWDEKEDLGLSLSEKGVRRTKLTIDQAARLLEKRAHNSWWGVDMYSQKTIDLLREEYEAWGRGENKARKWFEVEEWYDMEASPMPRLSRDQALYVLMCMDQPNVFDTRIPDFVTPMRRRGWTDAHKERLERLIGSRGMALKEVLFEQYGQVGDMIRPLYEDRYGVPFSKRRDYAPLRWMVDETRPDADLAARLGDDGSVAVGRSDGFLSVRNESHQRYLDTTQGALRLYWKHHASTMNWVCSQEMVERYKGILSDPELAQKLKVNIGALDYRGFQTLINRLEHGGRDAVAELDAAEAVKNQIMNARAVGVLAGQVSSLLRQTTAVFNALHGCELSTTEWLHGMARVIGGKSVLSVRELFESDLFQARRDGYMYSVLLGYKKQMGGNFGLLEQLAGKSMNAMNWLDAGCNAVSFAAAFDYYYRQGSNAGMDRIAAMEYARDVIQEGLTSAQPVNWTQMPRMLEKTKGIFSNEWFLMSETLQRGATVMSLWSRGQYRLAVRSWLIQGVAMQTLGYLINNLMRPGGDEDEKQDPLNYLPGIFMGPLNGIPFLGKLSDEFVRNTCDAMGFKVQTQSGVAGSELDFMVRDLLDLCEGVADVDGWQGVRSKSRGVSTLAGLTAMLGAWKNPRGGAISSVSLGVATLANYLKHLAGMAERWFGE